MNSADYTFLLNQPAAVNDSRTDALEKIVAEFPYFQSARALRLKGLYNQNSFQYNFALKVTAAYTTDRSVLFDFITSDTFTAIHKGLYDQKLAELHDMEVNASEIIIEAPRESISAIDLVEASILTSIKESEAPFVEDEIDESVQENPVFDETVLEIPQVDALEEIEFVPTEIIGNTETNISEETEIAEKTGLQTPEQKLQIGEPLEFSKTETHSFQEWLQLSRIQPINREETNLESEPIAEAESENGTDLKAKKNALIDRFIQTNPRIPKMDSDIKPSAAAEQKEDHSSLMTETLARVYLEQKKYQKAIQAYEILILKYPEKSSFFADRISEVKSLQQNNIV